MNKEQPRKSEEKRRFNIWWIYLLIALLFIGLQVITAQGGGKEISWKYFVERLAGSDHIERIVVVNKERVEIYIKAERLTDSAYRDVATNFIGLPNFGPHYYFTIGSVEIFEKRMEELKSRYPQLGTVPITYETRSYWLRDALGWIIPIIIVVAIWVFMMRRLSRGMGGDMIFSFGKSRAQLVGEELKVNVTFEDVADLEEAKEEVREIIDFLKNPEKYRDLGGKIPKGVLLIGPPGTGKTLLAKAVAGEAGVPFFSISGSEFVELFVGVGASRVRDLFARARQKAPCIIFIDEIDAIGRARSRYQLPGTNEERENTLNQLLVEMDGFSSDIGIIVLAATNRPDMLDPALLRPGRFDRHITLDRPDIKGRKAIFAVHIKKLKIAEDVDLDKLAQLTPGFVGADIANVCNEAALLAARRGKKKVEMQDLIDAIDKVIGGLERKRVLSSEEKRIVSYHEAGHVVVSWHLPHADPVYKVTIVPRTTGALGHAQFLPKERYIFTQEELEEYIAVALGGRAAEEVAVGSVSTGAQNDLERASQIAHSMVTRFGMSEKIGLVAFSNRNEDSPLMWSKPYSEITAREIDEEVKAIVSRGYQKAKSIIHTHRDKLDRLAQLLQEKETLTRSELEQLFGYPPYSEQYKSAQDKPQETKPNEQQSSTGTAKEKSLRQETHTQ